jgi:hypothetical protein
MLCASLTIKDHAFAQSTAARVSGTVYDEELGVLPGAAITLKNLDTGQVRDTTSSQEGRFGIVGLSPGSYLLRVELSGFAPLIRSIGLTVGDDVELSPTLAIATLVQTLEVRADVPTIEPSQTELRHTITGKQVDELPVQGRDFTNLALLAPGILTNQVATGSSTGITAAGQTGRGNNYLVDGLTLIETGSSSARGGVSLDAVKEFVVLSNNFEAEYGQASGAVLSLVTRSGTNKHAGRASYFHRDERWDATSHAARLAVPPLEKSTFEQTDLGGFLGGPLAPDRAFFFGSLEHTLVDMEAIVTSGLLQVFRPGAPTHLPVQQRTPQVLGRSDFTVNPSDIVTVRYRMQLTSSSNQFAPGGAGAGDVGKGAPERAFDSQGGAQDLAVSHNFVRSSALNELRFQFATWGFDRSSTACPGCWDEERPGLTLGKLNQVPNGVTENRWQLADSFTYLFPHAIGEHSLKTGVEVSVVSRDARGIPDGDGTFTFQGPGGTAVFNPDIAETYPRQYTRTIADPNTHLDHTIFAAFVQDRWKPHARLTVNAGLRWDYDDAPGVSRETRDLSPRLGVAFDPTGRATTLIRGGLGRYYDQVPLVVASLAGQAATAATQILITNPGYPDPSGPNPNGKISGPPSTTRLVDMHVPFTDQFAVGFQRALSTLTVVTADIIYARGRDLLVTRDLNYPDLTDPNRARPDPTVQRVTAVESRGNSWYRGVQIGFEKRHAHGHSYTVSYTLSTSERDTEDYTFVPQDQRDFAADRGPAANDVRHRLSAGLNLDLPRGLRFTGILTAQSALPYTITTGKDDNRDGYNNDRPAGVGRNSARGADFRQLDVRLSKSFRMRGNRVDALIEAFNVANRANWTNYDGNLVSPTYGKPTNALPARQVQVGARLDF